MVGQHVRMVKLTEYSEDILRHPRLVTVQEYIYITVIQALANKVMISIMTNTNTEQGKCRMNC